MRNEKILPTRHRLIYMQLHIYFKRCIVWFDLYALTTKSWMLKVCSMIYELNWPLSVIEASTTTQKMCTMYIPKCQNNCRTFMLTLYWHIFCCHTTYEQKLFMDLFPSIALNTSIIDEPLLIPSMVAMVPCSRIYSVILYNWHNLLP